MSHLQSQLYLHRLEQNMCIIINIEEKKKLNTNLFI